MVDYAFKAMVLNEHSDLLHYVGECRRLDYLEHIGAYIDREYQETVFKAVSFLSSNEDTEKIYKECVRINDAYRHRVKRLRNKIAYMLVTGNCLFVTLTFTDTCLEKTSVETRRKYVRRFLKQYGNYYVANIDYGGKNDREHYHAVIMCDCIPSNAWQFGFSKIKNVRSVNDSIKLSKYISKLTNHAIKDTAKGCRIIYPKNVF